MLICYEGIASLLLGHWKRPPKGQYLDYLLPVDKLFATLHKSTSLDKLVSPNFLIIK